MTQPKRKAVQPSKIVTLKLPSNMLRGWQAQTGSAYINSYDRNDPREHEKVDDAGDGTISRQETTFQPERFDPTFLLEPDVTVTLMLHGAEISIPWFSSELQKCAIAGVTNYFRFGEGRSWDVNQAFQIQHTVGFRPISTHPVDAFVQMRGWLDAWLDFYLLKGDRKYVDRIQALQATFGHLTSAHINRRRRASAEVQSLVAQANKGEMDEHTDVEVASKRSSADTVTKPSQFHKENSPDIVINTHKSNATPETLRNEFRENEDTDSIRISQGLSEMVAESQKPALPSRPQDFGQLASDSAEFSCPAPKTTARKISMLQAREAEQQQHRKTPLPDIKRGNHENLSLVMRNGVPRNFDEPGKNSAKDHRFNAEASLRVNQGEISTEVSTSPFFGDSTPTMNQREGQLSEATSNAISKTQTAVNPSQRAVLEPELFSKFFILQDPFGKMHTIPLDQHWRIYMETLVQLESCRYALDQPELVTQHRYDLFNSEGSKLTVDLLETEIKDWDCVSMRFWKSSAAL